MQARRARGRGRGLGRGRGRGLGRGRRRALGLGRGRVLPGPDRHDGGRAAAERSEGEQAIWSQNRLWIHPAGF